MSDTSDLVKRSLDPAAAERFRDRLERQADRLSDQLAAGVMDNEDFSVGLELELYAVADASEAASEPDLAALPAPVFEAGAGKELGLHNAELNTEPDVFDPAGLTAQADALAAQFDRAQATAREHGCELVLDAMWTSPPAEGSAEYLTAVGDRDGVTVASNMRTDSRYIAIDNDVLEQAGGTIQFDVPGCSRAFPTILFESLATSIQPHLQIPDTDAVPQYYNAAIRTLGPLLALATNSPFLPPDLYTDVGDPETLLEETHHELRIAVFEQSVNQTPRDKVRVPADIDDAVDTVEHVVADDLYAPFLREWLADDERSGFDDEVWEFDHKRSTYWRWLRCVVGGDPVPDASEVESVRIEYRPLPTQPTIDDVVSLQVLTVGLLRGLVAGEHPIADLPWEAARRCFYDAARNGLGADLAWLTAAGDRTTDQDVIYEEVFEYARRGLAAAGLADEAIDSWLEPIETRWSERTTPSQWKIDRVRSHLNDGRSFEAAVQEMQARYIERSRETDSFVEWL